MKYKRIAVYPGSFDPVTNGHLDILERSLGLFDKVICAIGINMEKEPLFTLEERLDMLHHVVPKDVEVDHFQGLLVDYAKKKNADYIIRGLRLATDFNYEFEINLANKKLKPDLETIFLMSEQSKLHIQAKTVREISKYDIDCVCRLDLVPQYVKQKLKEKYKQENVII